MHRLRTTINGFFERYDVAWEALMGILVVVWLLLGVQPRGEFITTVENAITLLFALEFLVRFTAAFDHAAYFRGHWIDAVTLIPALRGFRLLRLLRLLRLVRATRGLANQFGILEYVIGDSTIRSLLAVWLSVMALCSLMFYVAEARFNPSIETVVDAGWWALVTATTVGYGDIYPVTTAGRLAGIVMMLVGIATFSALAGLIGSALQRRRTDVETGVSADDMADEGATGADTGPDDPVARLRRLEVLRREGLITAEEYASRRATIVDAL